MRSLQRDFNLEKYLVEGVEETLKSLMTISRGNLRSALFLGRYVRHGKKAMDRRTAAKERGIHVPPFLIASITGECNLNCAGCYAMARPSGNPSCEGAAIPLETDQWERIFAEAEALGIGFVLLAGGEPLLRPDVLKAAGERPGILFPVFTNGTLLGGQVLDLFKKRRNLVPVLSLEGGEASTDQRRGQGVFREILDRMDILKKTGILYGASVTVTGENLEEVLSRSFRDGLADRGCRAVIYVEYVPMGADDLHLAPGEKERIRMMEMLDRARQEGEGMLLIAFPGDEEASGGCLATGRGFIHIHHDGRTEPCPFSPYSDTNIAEGGILGALDSPLFRKLRESGILTGPHAGGCVLHQHRVEVEAMAKGD